MSDQYGSFDNPYGGKPPFEGQEPPAQPPYAPPGAPFPPPHPAHPAPPQAQPQGWGHVPPGYGQVPDHAPMGHAPMGQAPMGHAPMQQPPAYMPYYPPKQVDPDARPGTVTAASVMTIVGAAVALLIALVMVPAGISDYNDPTSGEKGVTLTMVIWFIVCGVLSLAAIPLGIMVLFRSKAARVLLTVVGSIAALLSIFTVLYPVLIIAGVIMLYAGRAGDWFARRPTTDPLRPQVPHSPHLPQPPSPNSQSFQPPTHQRF